MLAHHRSSLDPDPGTWPDFKHSLKCLKEEAGTILHGSAVLVGSSIGDLVQELLKKVDKSALYLDTVEARVTCNLRGMSKVFNGVLDVLESHLTRDLARDPAALDVDQLLGIYSGGSER